MTTVAMITTTSVMSHPVLKAKPNALITCAPVSSYTHT
jgi:H+/gluconate symporter-like permease